MIDDTVSAQAEGEALPASGRTLADCKAKLYDGSIENDAKHASGRALDAIERWYAAHFHRCAVAGVAPLSADDKAALIQHVADAVAPPATQE